MTKAICFTCGSQKFGALIECNKCGEEPKYADDVVHSLIQSDHYCSDKALNDIKHALQNGQNARPSQETIDEYKNNLQLQATEIPLGDSNSFFDIFLTKNKNPPEIKYVLVADQLRVEKSIKLLSKKLIIETKEVTFCYALLLAKLAGWRSGRRFFHIKNGTGYPTQLVNNMGMWDDEAKDFSSYLKKYLLTNPDPPYKEETIPAAINELLVISNSGGFFIHT